MSDNGRKPRLHLAATLTLIAEEPVITGAEIDFHGFVRLHVNSRTGRARS